MIHEHEAQVDYYLRKFNLARGIRDLMEGDFTLDEVALIIEGMATDVESGLNAALAGWTTPWTWTHELLANVIESNVNMWRDTKKHPEPFRFWRPRAKKADKTSSKSKKSTINKGEILRDVFLGNRKVG